jgi:hypothetical protein
MMKALTFLLWGLAAVLLMEGTLLSEKPATARPPAEVLQQMKAQNAALIEKQNATLQLLDDIAKEAQQIKVLGKRS